MREDAPVAEEGAESDGFVQQEPSSQRKPSSDSDLVLVVKSTVLPPQSQMSIKVRSDGAGISYLTPKDSLLFRHNVRLANGIADIDPAQEFEVLIANFGKRLVRLHKRMIVGYAKRHPLAILTPKRDVAEPIAAIMNLTQAFVKRSEVVKQSDENDVED